MNEPQTQNTDVVRSARAEYERTRDRIFDQAVRAIERMPDRITVDEADEQIRSLNYRQRLHDDAKWMTRFVIGELVRRIRQTTEHGNVGDMMRSMSDRFGIGVDTIRYAMGVAEAFHGNARLFALFLKTGEQKHWYHMKRITRRNVDPTEIGLETYVDEIVREVETAANRVQDLNDAVERDDTPEARMKAESVTMVLSDEAVRARHNYRKDRARRQTLRVNGHAVETTETDAELEAFLHMVRHMPCFGCADPWQYNRRGQTDPHHVVPSAVGQKRADFARIPLCERHHAMLHTEGHRRFKDATGVDVRSALARVLHIWNRGVDIRFPPGLI